MSQIVQTLIKLPNGDVVKRMSDNTMYNVNKILRIKVYPKSPAPEYQYKTRIYIPGLNITLRKEGLYYDLGFRFGRFYYDLNNLPEDVLFENGVAYNKPKCITTYPDGYMTSYFNTDKEAFIEQGRIQQACDIKWITHNKNS